MSERVLVTGADGFVGRRLVRALRDAGYGVYAHSGGSGDIARCRLDYPGVTRVFHLAARSFVPDSWADARGFYEVNVLGTVNVLEFCRAQKAALLYVSSYVYGTPTELPIPESHRRMAVNPYGHTKILAEDVCDFYAAAHGVRVCVVRPFNLYGPGQDEKFLIPLLIRQAADPESRAIEVADDLPKRDYLHVDDLIRLLLIASERNAAGVYNAGSGESVSIRQVVEILNQFVPTPKALKSRGERRPQEIMDVVADVRKAASELGWNPCIPLRDGLAQLMEAALAAC
jgi:nucleoside-diphosphate-sugar epimerase